MEETDITALGEDQALTAYQIATDAAVQGEGTWLIQDGKRIAAIVPVRIGGAAEMAESLGLGIAMPGVTDEALAPLREKLQQADPGLPPPARSGCTCSIRHWNGEHRPECPLSHNLGSVISLDHLHPVCQVGHAVKDAAGKAWADGKVTYLVLSGQDVAKIVPLDLNTPEPEPVRCPACGSYFRPECGRGPVPEHTRLSESLYGGQRVLVRCGGSGGSW